MATAGQKLATRPVKCVSLCVHYSSWISPQLIYLCIYWLVLLVLFSPPLEAKSRSQPLPRPGALRSEGFRALEHQAQGVRVGIPGP